LEAGYLLHDEVDGLACMRNRTLPRRST
jgi:hypothetical protein